jgi:hypothetical protein
LTSNTNPIIKKKILTINPPIQNPAYCNAQLVT